MYGAHPANASPADRRVDAKYYSTGSAANLEKIELIVRSIWQNIFEAFQTLLR
jgi:hypothetical protein